MFYSRRRSSVLKTSDGFSQIYLFRHIVKRTLISNLQSFVSVHFHKSEPKAEFIFAELEIPRSAERIADGNAKIVGTQGRQFLLLEVWYLRPDSTDDFQLVATELP